MFLKSASYVEGYKVKLVFEDGSEKLADFTSFLKSAKNPMTKKYLKLPLFKRLEVKNGILSWNNFELAISPENIDTYLC